MHLSITFPEDLKIALDREAKRENTKRSTLIQTAVRVYLGLKKHKELSALMREGYIATALSDRQLSKDWDIASSDGLDA